MNTEIKNSINAGTEDDVGAEIGNNIDAGIVNNVDAGTEHDMNIIFEDDEELKEAVEKFNRLEEPSEIVLCDRSSPDIFLQNDSDSASNYSSDCSHISDSDRETDDQNENDDRNETDVLVPQAGKFHLMPNKLQLSR